MEIRVSETLILVCETLILVSETLISTFFADILSVLDNISVHLPVIRSEKYSSS